MAGGGAPHVPFSLSSSWRFVPTLPTRTGGIAAGAGRSRRHHGGVDSDRLGSTRKDSERLGSTRIDSDRLGSNRIGSDRPGSTFGTARIGSNQSAPAQAATAPAGGGGSESDSGRFESAQAAGRAVTVPGPRFAAQLCSRRPTGRRPTPGRLGPVPSLSSKSSSESPVGSNALGTSGSDANGRAG